MHPSRAQLVGARVLGLAVAVCFLVIAACGSKSEGEPPPSVTAKVKFKGNDRLLNDMAQALALDKNEVCNELGRYSCTQFVHKVALGGVAAYEQGLFEPLPAATVTSPIAAERVALSACITRVDRDLGGADPVIFAGLDITRDGKLASVDDKSVGQVIDTLYKRAVQRPARSSEIDHLRQLYRDTEKNGSTQAARDWAVLGCFAVMTTLEQLFY